MHYTHFTAQNGDRNNVQNIAVVITDGVSTVNVTQTKIQADLAKDNKISVMF